METKKYIAICKKTNKVFNDFNNVSGALTQHLLILYPNIKIPSSFLRRQYKMLNNKYWHEQYFNIVEDVKVVEIKKCKYCEWTTKDLTNKSGCYTNHLFKNHKISKKLYLEQFPNEYFLFQTFENKKRKEEEMLSSKKKYVICKICNKKLKSLTNTHLKKHNTDLTNYKLEFPKESYHSKNFIKKTSNNLKKASFEIKKSFVSKPEKSLKNFLKSLNLEFDNNNRKFLNGIEIDVIIHEKQIGIEFNGNLYHSENYGGKMKQFHLHKTELMNKKNYGLIHIFEDEWELKNDIVKNKLKHLFKKTNNSIIFARKCIIKEISSDIKNDFLNKYHIQGEDKSNIHIGAYFNNILVSVMTFDNLRQMNVHHNDKQIYELKRFCVSSDFIITGIAGKLLKFFVKKYNPIKIISFADRRWTLNETNNLYIKLGFKLTKVLAPDYSYFNQKIHRLKRFHKFSFGKSSLKNKFPQIYDDKKTEWEMMQELGYDRIWDCGKFKYEMFFK